MITFQLESWAAFAADAQDLWQQHYAEIGDPTAVMALDHTLYAGFEAAGQLQVLTAREQGRMVGYVVMLVRTHPHYKMLCGFEDAYFLTPSSRKGLTGFRMLKQSVEFAKARGVRKVFFHSKRAKDLQKLFINLGFVHSDELWSKVL